MVTTILRKLNSLHQAGVPSILWQAIMSNLLLYKSLTPDDLFEIVMKNGLHFNQSTQIGVVFHMLSSISQHGRLGLTAVGESHEQAYQIYERAMRALQEEAKVALNDPGLPA